MKKLLLVLLALMIVGAAGAAAWWKYGRRPDHLALGRAAMAGGDLRTAALELRNAVRDAPESVESHYRLGYTLLQLGDAVAAQKELEQVRKLGGGQADVPVLLAQAYLLQGQNRELLAQFKPPMANAELTAQLLVIRGLALNTLGDQAGAMSALATAEAASPNSASVLVTAARIALLQGNLPLAMSKVEHALALDPRRVDAMLIKSQAQIAGGNRDAALETLNQALSIAPRYLVAHLERANVEVDLGQDDAARADVAEVLRAQPNATPAIYLDAVLLARAKKSAEADEQFQRINTVLDRFPRSYFFIAAVKFDLGQTAQALDNATRYNARNPGDADGVKLLAKVLLASKRADQAIDLLTRARNQGIGDADTAALLNQAYVASGRTGEAVASLQQFGAPALPGPDGGPRDLPGSVGLAPDTQGSDETAVFNALRAGDLDVAAQSLDRLRAREGRSETVGLYAGLLSMLRQDYPGARKQYEALIAANPNAIKPRIGLAQIDLIQGRSDDAEHTLEAILAANPSDGGALQMVLPILLSSNRLPQAIALFEAAIAAAPKSQPLALGLIQLYMSARQPAQALSLLDRIAPQNGEATLEFMLARAHALAALDRRDDAIAVYRAMLNRLPGDPRVVGELMALQQAGRNFDAARQTALDALKNRPNDIALMRLLVGNAMLSGGKEAGEKELAALDTDPLAHALTQTMRGDLAARDQRYADAAEIYAAEYRAAPSSTLALSAAQAYARSGNLQRGDDILAGWLEQHGDDAAALRARADLQVALGQPDIAIRLTEQAAALDSEDWSVLNNLAWLYAERGDKRALPIARRSFALNPSPQAADTLGWILLRDNQPKAALPVLVQAAAALRDDSTVQYHLAMALARTGRQVDAIAALRPLAEQQSAFPEQADARKLLQELQSAN
jgi:cellulose synthase operon protein C